MKFIEGLDLCIYKLIVFIVNMCTYTVVRNKLLLILKNIYIKKHAWYFYLDLKINLFISKKSSKMSATGLSVSGERTSGDSIRTQNG